MLQRIQSIYLLLVFVSGLLFGMLPMVFFPEQSPEAPFKLAEFSTFFRAFPEADPGIMLYLLFACLLLVLVVTVLTTFQFRNRIRQIRMGKFNMFMHAVLILLAFFFVDGLKAEISATEYSYGAAVVCPVISLIFILLANRAIRKDEELVRSANRFR